MNEGSPTGEQEDQYVEVLYDYKYEHKGQRYFLHKGEIFMVVRHASDSWWQVIRQGEMRAFFAPADRLKPRSLSEDEKQEILSGRISGNAKTVLTGRSLEIDKGGSSTSEEYLPTNSIRASQAPKLSHGHRHESSSSHTSKSSLNEGSAESLDDSSKPGVKTGSVDELRPKVHNTQALDVCKKRASSNEELDGRGNGSSDLSLRHRSSSVDLRITHQELSPTEKKHNFPDKPNKVRISKDQWDRRRSWALENRSWTLENIRPSLRRGETVDAAIVLDVPPELPPKTKPKHRLSTFNSNTETISRLEGPIDLKVEQIRMAKSAQPLPGDEFSGERECERKHSRHSSDPLVLHDEKISSLPHQETHNGKDPPVALPRKLLPPQATSLEGRDEVSFPLSDHTLRDANGNKVKKSSSHSSLSTFTTDWSGRGKELHGSFRKREKACEPHPGKPSSNLEVTIKNDSSTTSHKIKPESPKTRTVKNRFPLVGSFRKNIKKETKEKEEREKELSVRETPTPDSSRGGKVLQSPPSPRCPPQRTLSGDWGEYIDTASKRPYYYNSNTREKRWKPPRKGVPSSNSILEIPTSTTSEDNTGRGNVPPKCPTPDYPSSPRSPHKPFSYTSSSDMPHIHPIITRSATLNPSSTSPPHSTTAALSHTLPSSATPAAYKILPQQTASKHKVMPLPLSSPPAVPPSSAKPTFPTTPTTPEFTDATAMSEYKYNALLDILPSLMLPQGWEKKYEAYDQSIYFLNTVTKERWKAAATDEGKVYYYEEKSSKSAWSLPKVDDADLPDQEVFLGHSSSQPQENLRLSNITESLHELKDSTLLEGFLHRTFFMREGKKLRKNWTNSYARYIMRSFNSGSTGIIHFSKSKDDDKKAEIFEFHTPCYMEQASDKKTSRQQVLVLRNDVNTEVLLQFEDREIAQKWIEVLKNHEGLEYNANPLPEKEERKGKKGSEKSKHETSMEQLSPDSKGIKDKLRNFIKRRPMKETLEHKGIYKESVFGSTLAELTSQDKTNIPIFVLYCIKHIEKSEENLRTDGLYRISGNAAQIQKIRYEVAQRKYTVLSQEKEIHNLSGALKLFFRELKEPLIPYDNYEDFIRATGSEFRRKNQQADKLMKAVNKLPVENYDTLKLLMQHLLEVSKYESENRMSLSNLAIVFGPCLMWPRETHSHDLMTDVMLHNRVVEGLLSDFDKIFTKR